ncbi:MAG TPA: TRAM domain-containing protein [Marmoricola sp.]|nr:TRAM domain-containing protein [Marmoricola sp.]
MSRRQVRQRAPRGRSLVGVEHEVDVGAFAHGGACVARLPADVPEVGGVVVFVRHALPGERVTVRLTEGAVGDRFLRGDAVTVHRPSPDRVDQPCPYAGPGRCGGCDLQHVDLAAQRRLKAGVVAEQLHRIAGLEREVVVEGVPGDLNGLRYRTRMRFIRLPDGRLGLRKHRSRELVPIDDCRIQAPGAVVTVEGEQPPEGTGVVTEHVAGHDYEVARDGFWQVHRGASHLLVGAVLDGAHVRPGDRVVDLYCGVGLYTVPLAEATGAQGHVLGVEGDGEAVAHAERNAAAYPWVEVARGPVDRVLARADLDGCDIVVLDPPREGAKRAVVEAVAALRPARVVHVACDPASLARDVALFAEAGYGLEALRAFDLFPMTHHVECVALLEKTGSDLR